MKRGFTSLTAGMLTGGTVGESPAIHDLPQVGTCIAITAAGVMFEVPALAPSLFGPASWCVGSYSTAATALAAGFAPNVGDTVLVLWAGVGVGTPWIGGWTR